MPHYTPRHTLICFELKPLRTLKHAGEAISRRGLLPPGAVVLTRGPCLGIVWTLAELRPDVKELLHPASVEKHLGVQTTQPKSTNHAA